MEALTAIIAKTDNVAILVLALVAAGLGYLHIVWRREEREDRRAAFEALDRVTEALNSVKNAISAITGKPL